MAMFNSQSQSIIRLRENTVNGSTLQNLEDFVEHPEDYDDHGEADQFAWLLEDVSLREYYRRAGDFAAQGEEMHAELMEDAGRCPDCHCKQWDCQCYRRRGNAPKSVWADIPRIPLFRGRRN
jgi:hypothetical protein